MAMEEDNETAGSDLDNVQSNEGWADTMQKILKSKKPKRKKSIVLAKARKLSNLKFRESASTEEPVIKLRKVDWLSKGRTKPNPLERNREKALQKIAVKGVIQLFNAVNQLQKKIVTPTSSTFKEEKKLKSIDKNVFLDLLLKGSNTSKTEQLSDETNNVSKSEDIEEDDPNTWNVLKNNFMTSTKWKNWDKSNENPSEVIEV